MDTSFVIAVLLSVFGYLVVGFRFAKFNIELWKTKMGNGRFNPNANMFGIKTPAVENLLFFALFPLTAFLIILNKPAPEGSFAVIVMERRYEKVDVIGITLGFPLKFAVNAVLIAFLFGIVPLAMFAVSIIYPSLMIFSDQKNAEEKQEEATE